MNPNSQHQTISKSDPVFASHCEHARVKIFAVGSAGAAIVEHLIGGGFDPKSIVLLNTRAAALARSSAAEKIHLHIPHSLVPGRVADGSGWQSVLPNIRKLFETADVVFVVAGLGGRTGTVVAPLLARAAREAGVIVLAFVTLPFDCEGSSRQEKARTSLDELRATSDGVICLPSQKICGLIDENTILADAFKVADRLLGDALRGVARMLCSGGLIDIHLSDLCMLIGGRHTESSFATAEASGRNRSREAVERLLAHPLLDGGKALGEARAVLVSVVGGPDLTIADVTRVMEQINKHCEKVPVVLGAAVDETFADRLAVTLLTSKRDAATPEPPGAGGDFADEPEESVLSRTGSDHENQFTGVASAARTRSRVVAPQETGREVTQNLIEPHGGAGSGRRKTPQKMRQGQLPLEIVSKGRFDKCEPTIYNGEDLDLPTFVRRHIVFN